MPASANLLVLYGSQTGTAEDVAERVAREAFKHKFRPFVSSLSDIKAEDMASDWNSEDRHVIFIAATTGQGDCPDDMKRFWKSMCRSDWRPDSLNRFSYAVIALGDSSYEKYNFVGKKLFRRFKQLGAKPLLDICLGDDQHDLGYHAAVNPWLKELWTVMDSQFRDKSKNEMDEPEDVPLAKFVISESLEDGVEVDQALDDDFPVSMKMELRKVVVNERVTSKKHWQDTRLITVDLTDSNQMYSTGDVLTVQPSNLPENVTRFFEIFPGLRKAPPIYVHKNPKFLWGKITPEIRSLMGCQPWTWTAIATHMLDIQSVPRQYFFELMSKFATNDLEKERLTEFCTPSGQEDLFSYCNRPKRNILEVLRDFPCTTLEIPPDFLFDMIPTIKARSFSIASSQFIHPEQVDILVAVVEYQTKIKEKRQGLCSNWLAHHCPVGSFIPVWTQSGSFYFPPSTEDTTALMIGPGTGIAPFRAVVSDRCKSWNKWVIFGCRNKEADFYFEEEWREKQRTTNLAFNCAFSRDSKGEKQNYVQDIILLQSEELGKLFATRNFYIYVAGNAKQMPKDVRAAIIQVMKQAGMEDAEEFLEECAKKTGRYQTETWS